ncbi:MAG TPA: M36 family metallopeptidase [Flavobacteriales bacterium]|nr:M36 family metallopeptidase [Flavobacteriales bacterium]
MLRNTLFLALTLCATATLAQKRPAALPPSVQERLLREGFLQEDLAGLELRDDYRTAHNGLHHTYFRQHWQGVEVWNGDIAIHTDAGGSVVHVNNALWPRLAKRVNTTVPVITAQAAMERVLLTNGIKDRPTPSGQDAHTAEYLFFGSSFSGEPVRVRSVLQPVRGLLRLAWNVNHYTPDGTHWWNVRIDALTGEELDRNDWTVSCGMDHVHGEEPPPAPAVPNDYNALHWPVESPNHGARTLNNAPWTDGGIASPYGWHDTDGAAGPEYTTTRGNNVLAVEDTDNNNSGGSSPNSPTLDFDYPLDLAQAPSTYQNAAITNLFYWNNLMHDVWYQYGFDEAGGNFQSNNYGRGGTGNDFVYADAQDGSGTDNANFSTPPDGSNPRMQMFRWTYTTPNRDSDLDNGIIAHEYGHGISNRLVGGPSNVDCLWNAEQMGEGWSDYFGLMMTMEPGDQGTDTRGVGTYVLGQPTSGDGIRPAPYSTDFGVNDYTYANTNSGVSQPHGIGFVWCTMLWEMTWELIDEYGFDPDIYNGTGGNNIAMQLVIDGLKLTPCSPGFVDARDAILAADVANNGGANQDRIWAAFARRGLGVSADQGDPDSRSDQTEAFNTPIPDDMAIANVLEPVPGPRFECNNEPVTVRATLRNDGQLAQSGFPVTYQLDGGALVTETFTGTLSPGQTAEFIFTTPLQLTGAGSHTLLVATALAGDGNAGNNSEQVDLYLNTGSDIQVPFTEPVADGVPTPTGWTLENPDNSTTWTTYNLNNGPACSSTTAWRIDNYSYFANGQEDRLVTPIIDLGGSTGAHLVFDHAYAAYSASYVDSMRVEISADCGGSWTTLWSAAAQALATRPYLTSAYVPANCSEWAHHDIDISAYDGTQVIVRFVNINGYGNYLYLDNAGVTQNGLRLALRLMLDGPYEGNGKMATDLNDAGLVPATEPYTGLGFTRAGGSGEALLPSATANTGDSTIVDWVLVELRDAVTPSTIVATRAALLQRDGDVVDIDGRAPVPVPAPVADYRVALRHRNHLGAMTANSFTLSTTTPTAIDLTDPGLPVYGTDARKVAGGTALLWPGNGLRDGAVKYTGGSNDRDPILLQVGSTTPNATAPGYLPADINLDGTVKYTGGSNDRDRVLITVGSTTPNATRTEQLP